MKLLVLLTDLFDSVGGIQTYNRTIIKSLCDIAEKNNLQLTIFVLNDKGNNPLLKIYIESKYASYKAFKKNRILFVLNTIFSSISSDLIIFGHINFLPLCLIINFLPRKLTKCLVIYGIDVSRILSKLYQYFIKSVDKIISISLSTKNELLSLNKNINNKFDILLCTLDPYYGSNTICKSRRELLLPPGQIILTVSRLSPNESYKNIDLVIKAMPVLLKSMPDVFFVIVGSGLDCNRLHKIAKEEGVLDKVIFAGKVSDDLLPSYYQNCDIFILPSTKEGFGIVFLEAMYYSKPCIGAKAAAVPEVIIQGKTGLLVEPGNISSISESITMLLKNKELKEELGKAGKKRLEDEFSFEKFKQKVEKIICT